MSAVLRQSGEEYAGVRMTAEEYLALGETFERYELVDGVVNISPRPSRRHQCVLALLGYQCELFGRTHSDFEFYLNIDIRFDARHVYAPDLCCFHAKALPPLDQILDRAPDLIIEILSTSNKTHDLIRKRADYGRFGVGEYWIIDPDDGGMRSFRRCDVELVRTPVASDSVASEAIPGLVLDLRPLRELAREE